MRFPATARSLPDSPVKALQHLCRLVPALARYSRPIRQARRLFRAFYFWHFWVDAWAVARQPEMKQVFRVLLGASRVATGLYYLLDLAAPLRPPHRARAKRLGLWLLLLHSALLLRDN
jgi:hypothetical protein